jgi:ATP-dependent phosphoenolpyruvate carboxykinase
MNIFKAIETADSIEIGREIRISLSDNSHFFVSSKKIVTDINWKKTTSAITADVFKAIKIAVKAKTAKAKEFFDGESQLFHF